MGTTMSVHGHALGQSCATYMRDSLSLTHSNWFNLGKPCVGNGRKLVGPLLGKKSRWVGPKNRVRNPVQNPVALTGASPVLPIGPEIGGWCSRVAWRLYLTIFLQREWALADGWQLLDGLTRSSTLLSLLSDWTLPSNLAGSLT